MATKAQLIAALVAAGIEEAQVKDKNVAELTELVKENVPDFVDGAAAPKAATRASDDPRTGKKIKCRIEFGSEPGGREDVYASVNGYNFSAKRGQEIELDAGFVDYLDSIVVTDVEMKLDTNGKPTGELLEVNRRRFQVSRL